MDIQLVSAIVFVVVLVLLIITKRKKLHIQKILFPLLYFVMYRTKFGIRLMEKIAKRFSRQLKYIGYFGIFIGFIGMAFIMASLIGSSYNIIIKPEAPPGVGIVQPFKEGVPGTVFVPFFYFIISIFVLAVVHEFSHGVLARKYGLKIKSSGFAVVGLILPILPVAFVEPDEKKMRKLPYKEQLSIFAAGPFSNIVLAFVILAISAFLIAPAAGSMIEFDGVLVTDFVDSGFPAEKAGIGKDEIIKEIDGVKTDNLINFSQILSDKKPGDIVAIKTDKGTYDIELAENPDDKDKGYLGVYVQQSKKTKESIKQRFGEWPVDVMIWLFGLFYWMFILNLGVGLFNLVPIGPIDGGRMLQLALRKFFNQEKADSIWKSVGILFLFLILINIFLAIFKGVF